MRRQPDTLAGYPHHTSITTRWADNDVYGHVNNSVYYFYFDTVVNSWLIENGLLEIGKSEIIGLVVETGCSYFAPLAYPETVTAGLRVARVGSSSVTYEIGLFGEGSEETAARGHFTHVYVDEKSRRPVPISDTMRTKLHLIEA